MLRAAGKTPAILTLLGDVAKGALAVIAGAAVATGEPAGAAVAAAAAVVGNCWSVFLGFRGGKGVATGLGAMLWLMPLAVLPAALVFVVVVATTRFVSLGSLLAAAGVPIVALALMLARGRYSRASVLAAFVADGHALSLVHGNHDIEFHWDAVKDDFRAMLLSHALARATVTNDIVLFKGLR